MKEKNDSFLCPNCGGHVPGGATACPDCGSDDETGWSADTLYDDLDLPDPPQTLEHLEAAEQDGGPARKRLFWSAVTILLIGLIVFMILGRLW